MENCIFCKIAAKEVPAEVVYEDKSTTAFLDNQPNSLGHTLVVPKKHAENIFDIDDETFTAVMRTVRKLAPIVRDAAGAHGVHINSNHGTAAGQIVLHLHMHIIPRHDRSEFAFWPPATGISTAATKEVAEKIKLALI